jgi:signal transduction histidine kinase
METGGGSVASIPLGDFLTSDEPVWVWDATACRIVWANAAGRAFWGAASVDALRARTFSARTKSISRMNSLALMPGEAREWVEPLELNTASGRITARCQMQMLRIAGGEPGLIVRVIDATGGRTPRPHETAPQQEGSAALEAVAARLKKASDLKSAHAPAIRQDPSSVDALIQSLRELSHEIRNPLSVIRGFAERIKDIAPPGKKRDQLIAYADDIMESADLAMAILSDFSTRLLHPDQQPEEAEPADLRRSVESCLRLIAPLAKASRVKVYRRIDATLPRLTTAERIQKQILLNLLMNAIRYHKTGGQIKVMAHGRKDGTVRLAVADDGKGMTKKEIRVALARSRKSPQPQPGRSGLGLPLVKRLVEHEGGRIAISSVRGKGTTVEIVFPAA